MKKSVLTAVAGLCAMMASTQSPLAADPPVYDGTAVFNKINEACEAEGYVAGFKGTAVLREEARESTRKGGGFSVIFPRTAQVFALPYPGSLAVGFNRKRFKAVGISSQVGVYEYPSVVTLDITKVSETRRRVKGSATNFGGVPGCVVEFRFEGRARQ